MFICLLVCTESYYIICIITKIMMQIIHMILSCSMYIHIICMHIKICNIIPINIYNNNNNNNYYKNKNKNKNKNNNNNNKLYIYIYLFHIRYVQVQVPKKNMDPKLPASRLCVVASCSRCSSSWSNSLPSPQVE